jgi:hypothetical protein
MFVEITDIAMNQPCKSCGRITNNLVAENMKIVKSSIFVHLQCMCEGCESNKAVTPMSFLDASGLQEDNGVSG